MSICDTSYIEGQIWIQSNLGTWFIDSQVLVPHLLKVKSIIHWSSNQCIILCYMQTPFWYVKDSVLIVVSSVAWESGCIMNFDIWMCPFTILLRGMSYHTGGEKTTLWMNLEIFFTSINAHLSLHANEKFNSKMMFNSIFSISAYISPNFYYMYINARLWTDTSVNEQTFSSSYRYIKWNRR